MARCTDFDKAAEVLTRAMSATGLGEQARLVDEALRLHRRALANERRKLARLQSPSKTS